MNRRFPQRAGGNDPTAFAQPLEQGSADLFSKVRGSSPLLEKPQTLVNRSPLRRLSAPSRPYTTANTAFSRGLGNSMGRKKSCGYR